MMPLLGPARDAAAQVAEIDAWTAHLADDATVSVSHLEADDFAHLAAILSRADSRPRLALCLDTCHVHAAGYDVVSRDGWRRTLDELDAACGLGLVRVIHANDSKKERGCRVDRHERIGRGAIGPKGFANLMTEPAFEDVAKILETPKDDEGRWDREGLAELRRLARRKSG